MERRNTANRVQRPEGDNKVIGYAAVYYNGNRNTEYELWPGVFERIAPGAFDRAIGEGQDVAGLFNHDPDNVLGRTPGSLKLSSDGDGLRYEIDLADTTLAQDVGKLVARGDVRGSSFAFSVRKEEWEETDDGREIRTILDVDLYDVGPVTFPAYEGTSAGTRAKGGDGEARSSYEQWKASQAPEPEAVPMAVATSDHAHRARVCEVEIDLTELR